MSLYELNKRFVCFLFRSMANKKVETFVFKLIKFFRIFNTTIFNTKIFPKFIGKNNYFEGGGGYFVFTFNCCNATKWSNSKTKKVMVSNFLLKKNSLDFIQCFVGFWIKQPVFDFRFPPTVQYNGEDVYKYYVYHIVQNRRYEQWLENETRVSDK